MVIVIAIIAGLFPARKAIRLKPAEAVRGDSTAMMKYHKKIVINKKKFTMAVIEIKKLKKTYNETWCRCMR